VYGVLVGAEGRGEGEGRERNHSEGNSWWFETDITWEVKCHCFQPWFRRWYRCIGNGVCSRPPFIVTNSG
jgi:hypothetical protein